MLSLLALAARSAPMVTIPAHCQLPLLVAARGENLLGRRGRVDAAAAPGCLELWGRAQAGRASLVATMLQGGQAAAAVALLLAAWEVPLTAVMVVPVFLPPSLALRSITLVAAAVEITPDPVPAAPA